MFKVSNAYCFHSPKKNIMSNCIDIFAHCFLFPLSDNEPYYIVIIYVCAYSLCVICMCLFCKHIHNHYYYFIIPSSTLNDMQSASSLCLASLLWLLLISMFGILNNKYFFFKRTLHLRYIKLCVSYNALSKWSKGNHSTEVHGLDFLDHQEDGIYLADVPAMPIF